MALVRKTAKLEELIVKKLMEAKLDKIRAIFKAVKISDLMANFVTEGLEAGLIIPDADKEWAIGRSQATYKDYVGFAQVNSSIVIREPIVKDIAGFLQLDKQIFLDGPILPCFMTPRMTYMSDMREVTCAFSSPEDYTSVQGFNTFKLCMTIPAMKRIEQEGKAGPITYVSVMDPNTFAQDEYFQHVLCVKQYERARPINIIDYENRGLPSGIVEQFLNFLNIQEQILKGVARIEKSQQYIFGELWKLPSVNKMREFFPAIRAFLPDETINKLNEGASARKKEYNVSLPDPDVIVSATEASIKT